MTVTTYVYDGQEVIKTGRTASRFVKMASNKPDRELQLIEITPAGETDGWKKWVEHSHLYIINPGKS